MAKTAATRAKWRAANPDKVSAQNARYREKHAAEINAKRQAKAKDKARNHLPPAEFIVVRSSHPDWVPL